MADKSRITVSRDACLHKIPRKQYWFDADVAKRIHKEQITFSLNPSKSGLMIVERDGHSTNAGDPGARSVALLVTGERYARRSETAGETNYTRAAFMKKKAKKSVPSITHAAKANGAVVKYEKPVGPELVTVLVDGRQISGTVDSIRKLLNIS